MRGRDMQLSEDTGGGGGTALTPLNPKTLEQVGGRAPVLSCIWEGCIVTAEAWLSIVDIPTLAHIFTSGLGLV